MPGRGVPGRNRRAGMCWRSYVGKGRPASFHADSASCHIIATRSAGVDIALMSSADSSSNAKRTIGQAALATLRCAAASGGSTAIGWILAPGC